MLKQDCPTSGVESSPGANAAGGVEKSNHTQTPNSFFDKLLPQITSLCELKVTLSIIRQTCGWHKTEDRLSITRLMRLTGLSRQGVIDGVEAGMRRGTIVRRRQGAQDFIYCLKLTPQPVNDLDRSDPLTSTGQQSRPVLVNGSDRSPVNDLDPQEKQEIKGKKEDGANAPAAHAAAPAAPPKQTTGKNSAVNSAKTKKGRAPVLSATGFPADFTVDPDMRAWASANVPTLDVDAATSQWSDAMLAKGYTYVDWRAAWRNGMTNAAKWAAERRTRHTSAASGAAPRKDASGHYRNPMTGRRLN